MRARLSPRATMRMRICASSQTRKATPQKCATTGGENKIWMSDPDAGTSTSTFNAFGELTATTDARNQTTTVTYDLLGRVLRQVQPEGTNTFQYDTAPNGIGFLASENSPGFARNFYYDSLSRLVATVETTASRAMRCPRRTTNTHGLTS